MASKMDFARRALEKCFPDQDEAAIDSLIEKDKSIKFAVDYFQPNEIPERTMLVSLRYSAGRQQFGFMWITNRRLVFAGAISSLFFAARPVYQEFDYASIRDVQFEKGRSFRGATIVMSMSDDVETPDHTQKVVLESIIDNDRLQAFVDYLQARVANPKAPATAMMDEMADAAPATGSDGDVLVAGLERLKRLKDHGALTEDEFQAAKRKLLDL